jgi:hypothetical protein
MMHPPLAPPPWAELDRPSRMIYFQPNQKRIRGNQNAAWRKSDEGQEAAVAEKKWVRQ